jgi:serine/threonine protein kinase
MAPEQMRSARNVDVRGDVWSLGVILYELLTGRVPFDGESMTELCLKVVNDPPRAPTELRADLPDALVKIVTRCLEKDPNNRFPNVAMLAEALEPFSASAERGTTDRTWRSLVNTADQLDIPASVFHESPDAESSPLPGGGTLATFGGTKNSKPAPKIEKRTFGGGVVAGVAIAAMLGAGVFFMTTPPPVVMAPSPPPPPTEVTTVVSTPTTSPSVTATPAPPASASAAAVKAAAPILNHKARPAASASPAASTSATPTAQAPVSAPIVERPNGAPILH